MKTERQDVYTQVTNTIIAAIEAGAGDWQMPWHRSGQGLNRPVNIDTANAYRGINVVSLWASAQARGFSTGVWGTYRQWQSKGCQVRKGEKSSLVVFYKEFDVEEQKDDGEIEQGRRLIARASYVFNADQVDGFESPPLPEPKDPAQILDKAETFVGATGADIRHGGNQAFYSISLDGHGDFIQMPERQRFMGTETSTATESYYSTLLHELTHWTGSAKRCNRQFGKRFGDDAYAVEELVAELGAAFLCADLGITLEPRPDHAAYLDHWLKVLKADKKAIFTAASQAAKATDYLAGLRSSDATKAAP
jgi:antirestriction protein ArdC